MDPLVINTALVGVVAILVGVVAILGWCAAAYNRRLGLARELDAARRSHTHREPARPLVPAGGARLGPLPGREEEARAAAMAVGMQPVRPGLAGDPGLTTLAAYKRELAKEGRGLDDLRIE